VRYTYLGLSPPRRDYSLSRRRYTTLKLRRCSIMCIWSSDHLRPVDSVLRLYSPKIALVLMRNPFSDACNFKGGNPPPKIITRLGSPNIQLSCGRHTFTVSWTWKASSDFFLRDCRIAISHHCGLWGPTAIKGGQQRPELITVPDCDAFTSQHCTGTIAA